jgi:DNA polymerase delta subunit 1
MHPYFYVRSAPEVAGREEDVRAALEAALPANLRGSEGGPCAVIRVERVRRTPVLVFQPEDELLKIFVAGPRLMQASVRALEQGIRVPPRDGGGSGFDLQRDSSFEANVSHVLRFLIDFDLGGGRWLELPAGLFKVSVESRATSAQVEVEVELDKVMQDGAAVQAISLDTELGSSIPPVRIAAFETLVDSDGSLSAAACVLTVQGQKGVHAKMVWLRGEPNAVADSVMDAAEEWSAVKIEMYDPSKEEPAKLFMSVDEDALVHHIGETLALLDADIVLTYDFSRTCRGLLGKKGTAKAGSPVARGLSRRLAAELRMTAKSNELSGLAGRLGFDLQKQVEKDHRLTDYSLGSVSEHLCQEPMPELSESTLVKLREERPRSYAQHVLRQAEACLRIFDHLAYLYNFVEMARVTGCPLAYLLERGQAVKVQAQLLREAKLRAFVLPSQRPGTGEESTFEGATVLEPCSGFYRAPVAVLDFASLYPSIMLAHNLCYSTMLGAGREKLADAPKHSVAPASASADDEAGPPACFVDVSVRKGLLPSILEHLLAARKVAKKQLAACTPDQELKRKVLHGRQLALKLSANSVYGFTGALNGPLPCLEVARSVTAYGREMIQATKRLVETHFVKEKGYAFDAEVLYGDTDSVMVRFGSDDVSLEEAIRLSNEAASVCSAAFPAPVHLEFEKVYRPFLLMAKKRYAGLAWTKVDGKPSMETKGLETVRRDWSDLVRQGLEQTLHHLLRADNKDGTDQAVAYVKSLCEDLRQNKTDFRSLVISKSLGREEYAARTPHMELAEKLRKRDPANAPRMGDRVSYLVCAGAAKAKVYEKVEDPLYALEHDLPIDAEYYLENQLKQPLIRVFEHVCGSDEKAAQALFAGSNKIAAAVPTMGGMGKFLKAKPKCLSCNTAFSKSDADAFCAACEAKGDEHIQKVRESSISKAQSLRSTMEELKQHCERWCALPPGSFPELPADSTDTAAHDGRERCCNSNCQVIFRRVRVARDLKTATNSLGRLKVTQWW